MANKRTLTIEFLTETGELKRGFAQLPGEAEKAGTGIVSSFRTKLSGLSSIGSSLIGGLVGGGVVAGFTSLQPAIASVVSEYQESVKVGRETERVIRSTGGAANVTAKEVENLAQKLSEKNGVDDETIQNAANLLLTFTNVKNVLGEGNDIYTQAVALSGDMAAALGTDQRSAALQLGKALNDPIKGITALSRAGVSFTQQQKDQIKWAMFFGDTLSAQKVILGEVSREFGGAAAAAATPLDKIKVRIANFQEALGKFTAEKAVPWLIDLWPKVQQIWTDGVAKARQIIEPFLNIVKILWSQFGDNVLNGLRGFWNAVQTMFQGAFTFIKGIVDFFLALLKGDWGAAWDALKSIVSGAWQMIIGAIQSAFNLIKSIFGIALEALTQIFRSLWDGLKNLASSAWTAIAGFVSNGINSIVGYVAQAPGKIGGLFLAFLGAGYGLGKSLIDGFINGAKAVGNFAADVATAILNAFKSAWNWAADKINDFIPNSIPIPFLPDIDLPDNPIPKFHQGGIVPGRPGSDVFAVLQAGERVIPRSQVGASHMNSNAPTIVVNVGGSVISERQLDEVVATSLARWQRHNR